MPGTRHSGGRNKRSAAAHVLRGTFRKDRHKGEQTPEAPQGVPDPPKPLEGDALDEWNRTITRLTLLGTLSRVDDAVIFQYCRLFADTEAIAIKQLEVGGSIQILEDSLGDFEKEDLLAAFQELTKLRRLEGQYTSQIRQWRMGQRVYLVELGLTPAARTRVKLPTGKPKADPVKERYFGRDGSGA